MPELTEKEKDEYIDKLENLLATAIVEWVDDWELLDEIRERKCQG